MNSPIQIPHTVSKTYWLKILLLGITAGLLVSNVYLTVNPLLVGALFIAPFLVTALVRLPEVSFMLLLMSGAFKGDPRLAFLPPFCDITVIFSLMTVFSILVSIKGEKEPLNLKVNWSVICFLFLIVLSMFSLSYSDAPMYGKEKFLRFATITSISFVAPFYIFRYKNSYRNFFLCFVFMAIAMIFDSLFSTATAVSGTAAFKSAFGSNYLVLAATSAAALLISFLYLANYHRSSWGKCISILMIPFFIFGCLISGGRGPVIALAMALATILGLAALIRWKQQRTGADSLVEDMVLRKFAILLIAGGLVVVPFLDQFNVFFDRMEILLSGGGESAGERVDRYRAAFSVFQSLPRILSGLGMGGYSFFYAGLDDVRGAYPHNVFLEIATELGLFGLAAFVFLLYKTMAAAAVLPRLADADSKITLYTLCGLFLLFFFSSQFSGDLNDNRMLFASMSLIIAFQPGDKG